MVKTPRNRHAKPRRQPVTIELAAEDVSAAENAAKQPDEIDVSVTHTPFEQMRDEPLVSEPAVSDELRIEEPIEDRVEDDPVRTGAARASYSFDASEREAPKAATSGPTPEPARAGRASVLAAGLIGAAATLAGVIGLQWVGIVPTPSSGYAAPSLQPLQAEIESLKGEMAALRNAPDAGDTTGLTSTLDEVKSQIAALQSAVQSGGAGGDAAVAALDSKLKEIEAAVDAGSGAPAEIAGKLTGLEGQVVAATEAATRNDGRIESLEQSISTLTSKVDQQASQPKVALAIAAAALKSAVERGGPFAAELETLAAIAPNAPELDALRQDAEGGIATEADIAESMPDAASAMIGADSPVDANAGVMQRLMDSAQSLVKVRPVGEVAGDDVGARVARMEVAVKAGNYQQAIVEYEALPDAVKIAGAPLADRIKARLRVTKLVDQLVAGAMKAA